MPYEIAEFSDLIARYSADFTGRRWLAEQVRALLDDSGYRFVVLTGEPGVGKTAFLAYLATTYPEWPRYFIRRDSQQILLPGDATTFFLSIGTQLATVRPELFRSGNVRIVAHQHVGTVEAGAEAVAARIGELWASPFYTTQVDVNQDILQAAGKAVAIEIGRLMGDVRLRSMQDLQQLALIEPCRVLAEIDPRARIVVLVDALDELRYSPAERDVAQALAEFPIVPPNLRFIVTSRPDGAIGRLLMRADTCALPLDMADADNRRDLREYAEHALSRDDLSTGLADEGMTPEAFCHELLAKAAGNFLYLKSVLNAIQDALSSPAKRDRLHGLLRVAELPADLSKLYAYFLASAEHWARERGFSAGVWRSHLAPLLGTLAASQVPLSVSQLCAFTSLDKEDISDLLRELRQFVIRSEINRETFYQIYHTSFAEYLFDSGRSLDFWIDGQKAHGRIAKHYVGRWGGLKAGLPGLSEFKEDTDSDYGLRHLAAHLDQAGRSDELYRLLVGGPSWMTTKFEYLKGDASYMSDLDLAMKRLADPLTPTEAISLVQLHAARRVVSRRVSIFSDTDLELLVLLEREEEALGQIRLRPSAHERLAGLLLVNRALRLKQHALPALLDEALDGLVTIDDVRERVNASAATAVALMESGRIEEAGDLFAQASQAALTIDYYPWQRMALTEVANSHIKIGEFSEACVIIRQLTDFEARVKGLRTVADALETDRRFTEAGEIYGEIAQMLRQETQEGRGGREQTSIFYALLRAKLFEEAHATALDMVDKGSGAEADWRRIAGARRYEAQALRDLAVALAAADQTTRADEIFGEAYQSAQRLQDTFERASALCDLITKLAKTGREEWANRLLEEAGETARSVRGWQATEPRYAHGSAIGRWITALLATGNLDRAKDVVGEADEVDTMARNIQAVSLGLAQAGRVEEARALAERSTEYYGYRASTFHELSNYFATTGQFEVARKIADENPYENSRQRSLRDLACAVARAGDFAKALAVIEPDWQVEDQASVLRVVIEGMARSNRIAEATEVFAELEETVYREQDPIAFGTALRSIALVFDAVKMPARAEAMFKEAENAARRISDFFRRVEQLRELAVAFATTGRWANVWEAERAIREVLPGQRAPLDQIDERDRVSEYDSRARAIRVIAEALADANRFSDAEEMALGIHDRSLNYFCKVCDQECVYALRHLFVALASQGNLEDARRIFDEAVVIANGCEQKIRHELIAAWSHSLAMARQFDEVVAITREVTSPSLRAEILVDLALVLDTAGKHAEAEEAFAEAQAIVKRLDKDYMQDEGKRVLVRALAGARRFKEASDTAQNVRNNYQRSLALLELAMAMVEAGAKDEADATFAQATTTIQTLEDGSSTAQASYKLISCLVEAGHYQEAKNANEDNRYTRAYSQALLRQLRNTSGGRPDDSTEILLKELVAIRKDPDVAAALAAAGKFAEALDILGPCDLDDFLTHIARWGPTLERIKPGLSVSAIDSVMTIIGWIRPDWRRVHGSIFESSPTP